MLPYSPSHDAPAAILEMRIMSSSGTSIITAFHSSGCWVNSTPVSSPPFEPPWMPSRRGLVTLVAMRSRADRREIVVDDLPLGAEPGLVPRGAELAAAADVGERIDAALLQPQLALGRRIVRRLADLEPAVGVEQGGVAAVELDVLPVDQEVGDFRAVARHRLALLGDEVGGVELRAAGA